MNTTIRSFSTKELLNILNDPSKQIIDTRPVDAYGWQMQSENRGGHIHASRSLPFRWTNYIDWIEMVRLKEIDPGQEIIVYGYNNDETQSVAKRFVESGYHKVNVYNHFIDEWSVDTDLPMQKLGEIHSTRSCGLGKYSAHGRKPSAL